MGKPNRKQRSGITDEVKQLVKEAYEDEETSQIMPGAKEVSLGNKVYAQKRLMLYSIKELFNCFVTKYPEAKTKLTSFYSLKPKWCVQAGKSGTHTVCVCAIHQNVVLLCDAINRSTKILFHILCVIFRIRFAWFTDAQTVQELLIYMKNWMKYFQIWRQVSPFNSNNGNPLIEHK